MKMLGAWLQAFPPHTLGNPGTTVMAQTNLGNTFTLGQTIATEAAESLTITRSTSPTIVLRATNTGAAAQELGQLQFDGEDSAGAAQVYGFVDCLVVDATPAAEDGNVRLVVTVAGTPTAVLQVSDGVLIGSSTGSFPGANKINANAYKVAGIELANGRLQRTYDDIVGPQALATGEIPIDDTTPAIGEGDELFSQAITPKIATSRIRIEGDLNWCHESGAGQEVAFALFKDSTCVRVWRGEMISNGVMNTSLKYEEVSGSTSARTYSLRWGSASGAGHTLNNGADGFDMGDKIGSSFSIEEFLA